MYAAKAVAAFVMLIVTGLVSAPDIVPLHGTVHLVVAIITIVASAVIVYEVPNSGTRTTVVNRP